MHPHLNLTNYSNNLKSFTNPAIRNLLNEVSSEERDVREWAVVCLRFLLEITEKDEYNRIKYYWDLLSWELLFVTLDEKEHEAIAWFVADIFLTLDTPSSGMLWFFGATIKTTGLKPLVEIIQKCYHRFDRFHSSQAFSALLDCLDYEKNGFSDETKTVLLQSNIVEILREECKSEEPDISSSASYVLSFFYKNGLPNEN